MGKKKQSWRRSEVLREVKGKEPTYCIPNLEDGDYVTIRKARPRRKYKRPNKDKWYENGKYFRVVAASNLYGCFVRVNSKKIVDEMAKEQAKLKVDGYRTRDLFNLDNFIANNFPKMIEEFLRKYQSIVSDESPNYSEVVQTLTELKTVLEDSANKDIWGMSHEEWEARHNKMIEVWTKFGKIFPCLWV